MSTPTRPEAYAKLQDVFRRVFDDDAIVLQPAMTSRDIPAWDSLNQIKIILGCERAFGIRLKPREINALENVDEMIDHLLASIAAKSSKA